MDARDPEIAEINAQHREHLRARYAARWGHSFDSVSDDDLAYAVKCIICSDTGRVMPAGSLQSRECRCQTAKNRAPFDPAAARIPMARRPRYSVWAPQEDAYRVGREWVENWPPPANYWCLSFFGPAGVGKSQLMAELVALVWELHGIRGEWWSADEILNSIKETFPGEGIQRPTVTVTNHYRRIPLLALDDLGAEYHTEWAESELFGILKHREDNALPTLITMNLESPGWAPMQERLKDRVLAGSFPMHGESRRPR